MHAGRSIAYRALTQYLTENSSHADARNAWVIAARDLYGACSFQAIQTGRAWDAVGLPPPATAAYLAYCGNYSGNTSLYQSANLLLANGCLLTVVPGGSASFGGNSVKLSPGFKAQGGSYFRAYTNDCFFTNLN